MESLSKVSSEQVTIRSTIFLVMKSLLIIFVKCPMPMMAAEQLVFRHGQLVLLLLSVVMVTRATGGKTKHHW